MDFDGNQDKANPMIWCELARVGAIEHCIETPLGSNMMMGDRRSNNMRVDVWIPSWCKGVCIVQVLCYIMLHYHSIWIQGFEYCPSIMLHYASLPQYLDTMTQYCRPVARVWVLSKSTHCVGSQLGLAATNLAIDFKGVIWANVLCNSQRVSNDEQRSQFVNELRIVILYHLPHLYWSFLLEVSNFEWFIWYFGSYVYYQFGNTEKV